MRGLMVLLLAGMLGGCMSYAEWEGKAIQVGSDANAPLRDGTRDGCQTAARDRCSTVVYGASWRRDDGRMRSEPDYERGWNSGYMACAKQCPPGW